MVRVANVALFWLLLCTVASCVKEDLAGAIETIPHIFITTQDGVGITSKDYYLAGDLYIDANSSGYSNLPSSPLSIKGRGNSTWGFPKKPYKIKMDSKTSLCGMAAEKDWVLLASYIDPTLSLNAVAMRLGAMLGAAYVNTIVPVDLTLNGVYCGSYVLTEQIEIKTARVNLGADGYILELDSYYDNPDDEQFRSAVLDLPVMVKDADFTAVSLATIQSDFNLFEALLMSGDFPDNNYEEYIDLESVAKIVMINELMRNMDLSQPRSAYMFKDGPGAKFVMGPLWDFDWCAGYNGSTSFALTEGLLIDRSEFWARFFKDPAFVEIYRAKWSEFRSNHKTDTLAFIYQYTANIATTAANNFVAWPYCEKRGFATEVQIMKDWFENRINYLDGIYSNL